LSSETWVLELEDIEKDTSKIIQTLTFSERKSKSTKNTFNAGSVLYGKLRPYLNKVVIAKRAGVCTTEIIPLDGGKYLHNNYLFHWLKHPIFTQYVTTVGYGVNMPRLGTKEGNEAPFVLAPLAEQHQIAQRLDELLAQVDTIKARLDAIPAILKRFRQSVLSAAVSGKLPSYGQEFKTNSFGELIVEMRNGLSDKPSENKSGFPILRISSVRSMEIDLNDIRYLECDENTISKYSLEKGDILFTRYNGSLDFVGVCSCFSGENNSFVYPDKLIRVKTKADILLPRYTEIFFSSPQIRKTVTDFVKSTSGQKGISGSDLKSIKIAYPPIEQQTEIVRQVDQWFTFADQIEQRVNDAKARVDKLTQSILAKAFRGELTADWRAEHPELISGENSAEALLAKIQTAKAALEGKKKKGKAA
jgi:type I restriction enzyme, S subunit